MEYLLTPHTAYNEAFVWWEGAFTDKQLDILQNMAKNATKQASIGTGAGEVIQQFRRSQVSWMSNTPDTKWVFSTLANIASDMNAQHYGFDLTGFGEPLQLTNYDQAEHGMYGWHRDCAKGISRKLSMVVQLSDPADYEGGNLQVFTGPQPISVRKQRGLVTIFPSYVLHQVTPVTQGNRQSLVAWVSGPAFK